MTSRSLKIALAPMACLLMLGCDQRNLRGRPPSYEEAEQLRVTLAKSLKDGGAAQTQKAVQKRTGWATIRGSVKVMDGAPKRAPLKVTKDIEVCTAGGKPVLSQAAVVDPGSGGLADVVFFAMDVASDNVHPDAQSGKTDEIIYDQKQCIFLSHVQVMQATQSLKILNSDPVPHNTKIDARRALKINASIPPGGSTRYKPGKSEKEPVGVSCSIHPWMSAYLLPRDDSYVAITAKDGSFEIANLPAGVDLVLQVWQERLGKNFAEISVNGTTTTWKRGRLALTKADQLKPDEVRTLDVKIPLSAFQ